MAEEGDVRVGGEVQGEGGGGGGLEVEEKEEKRS